MEGACWMLCGKLFQRRGALLEKERVPGREEGRNGRREFPIRLVRCECSVKVSFLQWVRGADL